MSSSWDKISAGRVLDMAEAKHLQVHDDAGNLVPAMRRGSTRVLGAARGLDADAARVHRRRLSSLEESARCYAAVSKHVERAKADGAYYELEFAEPRLGFTVALARHHAASASPRSPRARSWCTLSVEDMSDERLFESRLRPRDEVVTLAGQAVAIRDDDGYDDAQRYAAFGRIKAQIRDAPRPVTLGFVEGAGRGAAFAECLKRRELAAEDKARARAATAAAGAALRTAADDALRDCEDMARAADAADAADEVAFAAKAAAAAAKATRAAAKRARKRVVDARLGYAAARDPDFVLEEAEATDAHCVAARARAALAATPRRPPPPPPLPWTEDLELALLAWAADHARPGAAPGARVDWTGAAAALFPGAACDAARLAAKLAALVGGADAPDAVRRAYQKKRREAAARRAAAPLPFSAADEAAIREWAAARAIVGADGREAVDWAGAAAALFPGRGVDVAQIAECHRRLARADAARAARRRDRDRADRFRKLEADRARAARRDRDRAAADAAREADARDRALEAERLAQDDRIRRRADSDERRRAAAADDAAAATRADDAAAAARLARRSRAALDRCLAAERRVRACSRAAVRAARDAEHVQALIEAAAFRCAAADERGVAVEAKRLAASPR